MKDPCLRIIALFFSSLVVASPARPGTASQDSRSPEMEVVLVTGEQPGPALWRVSSGDHDLWLLGDDSPLPRKLKWRSRQFEALLAKSQEVMLHFPHATHSSRSEAREVV